MGLNTADLAECVKRPCYNLSVLCTGVDRLMLWTHGESEDGACMGQRMDEVGACGRIFGGFEG